MHILLNGRQHTFDNPISTRHDINTLIDTTKRHRVDYHKHTCQINHKHGEYKLSTFQLEIRRLPKKDHFLRPVVVVVVEKLNIKYYRL